MNTPTSNYFGLNRNLVRIVHYAMLFSMLHMSIVVPAQEISFLYKNFDKIKKEKIGQVAAQANKIVPTQNTEDLFQNGFTNGLTNYGNTVTQNAAKAISVRPTAGVFSFPADIKEGIIGATPELPIDYPSDNLFKINIAEVPSGNDKVFLKYEVYGVNNVNGVARSINDRLSTGGYLVKRNKNWSVQEEEIDAAWLTSGENKILFTVPKGANYQYKIKNLSVEVRKGTADKLNSLLVIQNNQNTVKDGKVYIKGFVRGAQNRKLHVEAEGQSFEIKNGEFEGVVNLTEAIKKRNFIAVKASDASGLLGQELFFLNTELPEADTMYALESMRPFTAASVKPFQKASLAIAGALLEVTDSAIVADKELSITQLRTIDIAPMGAGLKNTTKDAGAYRFLPDGTLFNKPVKITLEYDPASLPMGYTAKDIKTYFFDTKAKKWMSLPVASVDEEKHQITSFTTHFTDYVNGIIQAPESPQTSAFTPTTISDIKAADPSSGITLIAPPEPSQKGDANVSYPIKIPSGRKGMQPNLAIQYNSEGGNGWLGQGWNISTPAITIDTKWGVPNFVDGKETVIYNLNGEQLMYPRIDIGNGVKVDWMPNRHYDASSGSSTYTTAERPIITNAIFTPRKQGSFAKIERLGTAPSNYYWKVTGTDGTINWYGGKNAVDNNAVIKNSAGNIVHWGLYMTEDVYGNNVKYVYDNTVLGQLSGQHQNLSAGKVFHIKNIFYTGFAGANGSYLVDFVRETSITRQDITINGRLGVKQVEPYMLTRIKVKRVGASRSIREYELNYGYGTFLKKQLKYIAEKDKDNKEFYRHTFEYNQPDANAKGFFDAPTDISVPDFDANFILNLGNQLNASRLNSGESTELSWDAEAYPGLFQFFYTDNNPTHHIIVGLPFGESYTKSKGKITLSDMDGNGLDDVLYRKRNSSSLFYFPHKVDGNGNHFFDPNDSKEVLNINNFSKTDGKTKTMFGESVELGLFGALFGRKRFKTKEETSIYITDGNGDMLPDIVNDNVVYFNRGASGGTNIFETASELTPNMVITAAPREIDPADVPDPEPDTTPDFNFDVVRVWEAPRHGYISIRDELEFLPQTPESKVVYSIESNIVKSDGVTPYRFYLKEFTYSDTSDLVDFNNYAGNNPPLGYTNNPTYLIEVKKGQKIFFRLHKNAAGPNDILKTNPTVKYADNPDPDQNGNSKSIYTYNDDFILEDEQIVTLPNTGNVQIEWDDVPVVNPSDDVTFKIVQVTSYSTATQPIENVIFDSGAFTAGTSSTFPANLINLNFSSIPTNTVVSFKFIVTSDSNVKWTDMEWKPKFTFTPDSASAAQGATLYEKYVVPNYSIYQEFGINDFYLGPKEYDLFNECGLVDWNIPTTTATYKVAPNTYMHPSAPSLLNSADNGSFRFVVKKDGVVIGKRTVTISGGNIAVDGPPITFYSGTNSTYPRINCEFYAEGSTNLALFKKYTEAVSFTTCQVSGEKNGIGNVIIGYEDGTVNEWNYPYSDYYHYWRMTAEANHDVNKHLGSMHRSWGQFIYNDAFDNDTTIPSDNYSKLINLAIVENPLISLANGLGIDMNSCNSLPTSQEIADCINAQLAAALDLPPANTPVDANTDVDAILNAVLANLDLSNMNRNAVLMSMQPYRNYVENQEVEKWIGIAENQYSAPTEMRDGNIQDSYFGQVFTDPSDTDSPYLVANQDTGMNALTKTQNSVAVSLSAGYNSVTYTSSGSRYSNADSDFIDVNGDRYPDLLISNNAQTTMMTGGHRSAAGNYSINPLNSNDSDNAALAFSGSYTVAGRKKTGETKSDSGNPTFSLGINANLSGSNKEKNALLDLNGDGLPDRVLEDNGFAYQLNLGSAFTNSYEAFPLYTSIETKPNSLSASFGISTGFNIGNVPFSISLGYSANGGNVETSLQDMNGDGLLDLLNFTGGNATVQYNLGSAFSSLAVPLKYDTSSLSLQSNNKSSNASISGKAIYFYKYPICCVIPIIGFIPIVYYKGGGAFGASANLTVSETNREFKDFNGDGFADYVEKNGRNLKVYYSNLGKIDLLQSVTNPLGGKFTIDYKVQKVDFENPTAKWTMSEVVVEDGHDIAYDGVDAYKKQFEYVNGKYDRRERSFYGFETVKIKELKNGVGGADPELYRTTENTYHNGSYFLEGLLKSTKVYKAGTGNTDYSLTENTYELKKVNNNGTLDINSSLLFNYDVGGTEGRRQAGVLLKKTTTTLNNFTSNQIVTEVVMNYDEYGRVIKYSDNGDIQTAADNYHSDIAYHSLNNNILSVPKSIQVFEGSSSTPKRHRETVVANANTGAISAIKTFLTATAFAQTTLDYDQYGNLQKIVYPQNNLGQAMFYEYQYDSDVHKFVTDINDAFGYHSSASYDTNFDVVLTTTDLSWNTISYKYDTFGRLISVLAPKEDMGLSTDYTIKFEYMPTFSHVATYGYQSCISSQNFKPLAITKHFDPEHPTNPIETYTFMDGLARPIQIKKDIQLNSGTPSSPNYVEAMSVSGMATYDEFGRVYQQHHPKSETKGCATNFVLNQVVPVTDYFTAIEFDAMDRTVKTISPSPEYNVATMTYGLNNDVLGNMAITEKSVVDQTGAVQITTETFKDIDGKITSTKNSGPNGDILTRFSYNAIGELLSYTDAGGLQTSYTYDMRGKKTIVSHPDNGTTVFDYDQAGNMTKLKTANLAASNLPDPFIVYKYQFNRLEEIIYPEMNGNENVSNVLYKFGAPGSGNETGRLIYQEDATGVQEFLYGNMGELINNKRVVVGPNIPTRTFTTGFEYDSWNRIQKIIYPDGENVEYAYDLGGNLVKMSGIFMDDTYDYISQIDYDLYEQRTYLKYGNNTESFYQYTPSLRRLDNLNVKTSAGDSMFNNTYGYDKVGNVTSLVNNSTYNTTNFLGGTYNHVFTYDKLNRLDTALGNFTGYIGGKGVNNQSAYELTMLYNDIHGIVKKTQSHTTQGYLQNPDNTYDNHYEYHSGTHRVKEISNHDTGDTEYFDYDLNGNLISRMAPNGDVRNLFWDESNRLRVIAENEQMQHYIYDAAGERVLKGSSAVEQVYENGQLVNSTTIFGSYATYPSAYLVIDAQQQYSKHYYAGTQRVASKMGEQEVTIFEEALLPKMSKDGKAPTDFEAIKQAQINDLQLILEKAKKGTARFADYKPETDKEAAETTAKSEDEVQRAAEPVGLYFYHPDHLGTSTYLTDANGMPYQFFLNLPFGETMYEQHSYTEDYASPYKFSGKELDDETGLYYFGARYYDPRTSVWLGVDPLMEDYPSFNPYVYCYQNPIKIIDPTGMEGESTTPPDWIVNGNTVFYDPTVTTQEQATEVYGKDARHLKNGKIVARDGSYEYNLNNSNGTVTDCNGETVNTSQDIKTPGGHTIKSPGSKGGNYFGVGVGGSVGGGTSLEVGMVKDATGNFGLYFTFGGNVGFSADAGIKAGEITPTGENPFAISDFAGKSNSFSASLGPVGMESGGSDGSQKAGVKRINPESWGKNTRGYKYTSGGASGIPQVPTSFGVGAQYTGSKTWVWDF